MGKANRNSSVFKNTLAQSTSSMVGYALSFLLAPLLLSKLGLAAFGVWAVTGAMASYAGIADLGISNSLSRFVALYDAHGDERAMKECVGLGLVVGITLTVVGSLVAIVAAPLVSDELGVLNAGDMRIVLLCSGGILSCALFRTIFNSIGIGLRRMTPPNVASTLDSVFNFTFSVAILLISPTLPHYALANLAAEIVGVGASIVALRYVWRPLPIAFPSRRITREVLGFSLKSQVTTVANLVNLQTDKIIIALLVGVKSAAAYELGARVVLAARTASQLAISALIPTATASITASGRKVIRGFYERYTRLSVSVAFPILALSCLTAPFLLYAWLGRAPHDSVAVLVSLGVAYFINITTGLSYTVAIAEGHVGIVARNQALTAVLNIAFTAALAVPFGLFGVLAGTFAAITIGSALLVISVHRTYDLPASSYWSAVRAPATLAIGLAAPIALLDLGLQGAANTRLAAFAIVVGITVVYGVAYWLAASRLDLLPHRLALRRLRRPAEPPAGEVASAAAP